jgi:S-DNA-T family DNA segregation ATPase FtsK/SpoIIIE
MATKSAKKSVFGSSSRLNEVVALILLALTVLIFLSLLSFNESDPSLIAASSQKVKNWIGIVGANIAGILFSAVGLVAYVVPILLGLIAWRVFRAESMYAPIGRIVGFILFVASFSGLLSVWLTTGFRGGILGSLVAGSLIALIGNIGAVVLLVALFLASILLITDFTYVMVFMGFQSIFDRAAVYSDGYFSRFQQWRTEQRAAAEERLEKRRESRVERETVTEKPATVKLPDTSAKLRTAREVLKSANVSKIEAEPEIAIPEEVSDKRVEEIRPTIIFGEEPMPNAVTEDLPPLEEEDFSPPFPMKPLKQPKESQQIPIKPIQETGDLSDKIAGDADAVEEEDPVDAEPRKPQTYENYILPSTEFLTPPAPRIEQEKDTFYAIARHLERKTEEFNAKGKVESIVQGPVVTTYEFRPDTGVKYSKITGLGDDLCLALKAESIRIDRIVGKAFVGIEVPNHNREIICLREVIESKKFQSSASMLSIALGKSIDGLNYVADLTKMPHLLMAGQTGAGKSVGVNSIIVSILYKARPDEVKLIMVDPKQVELGIYADIPHLATPIITDPKRASVALRWAVGQMEKRYKDLAGWGVRNIDGYNAEVKRRNEVEHFDDNGETWKRLPYIVIIIDELADLMMVAGKEVEESITRLAQMARAVGIHLVLATQRPSVDVITGLIKANFPSRISFRVSSKVDSRTIIDANGAESLLGRGDMLFLPPGTSNLVRVHGAFVDEKEITRIVDHIKAQGKPDYDTTITKTEDELDETTELPGKKDPLFLDALRSVVAAKRASTSLLQRHLRIGYGRAAAILDAMVREGYIGEMDGGSRARPILEKAYEYLEGYDSANV